MLSRTNGPRAAWNCSALTVSRMPTRLGVDAGAGHPRALALPNRTGTGIGGFVAVVGGADQANSSEEKRLSSRMGAGGWTARGVAGWLAGSQIMPMSDKGRACWQPGRPDR